MFLSSFEKLRAKLLAVDIVNMAHLGARAFEEIGGEVVQTTSFVIRKSHVADYKGEYCRLIDPTTQQGKEDMFLAGENRYVADQSNFSKIPGSPVAYWVSERLLNAFATGKSLGDIALARNGMKTGENGRFVRLWWEVILQGFNSTACDWKEASSSGAKWFPYNKGGEFRKWYGNNDCIVNWQNEGDEIFNHAKADKRNVQDYPLELKFKPSASWSLVTSGQPAFRYKENNLSDIAGMSFFTEKQELLIFLGFCNSKIALEILKILAPTINFQAGDIGRLPIVDYGVETDTIRGLVTSNIDKSTMDWDSYETSWDFKRNPLVIGNSLSAAYAAWKQECEDRFQQLKQNEEELNRIFIDIYGLQDELTPDVADKDITVHRVFDSKDDVPESMKGSNYVRTMRDEIVSLISYAVGCMFGRYSLDVEGLAYAGGEWDASKYITFIPDEDNCIPVTDVDYFDDDIVGRFVEFVRTVYGEDTLEENLRFVADALGGKGTTSREIIRNYFLNDFIKDHIKTYQRRPIYWMFDSGKQNGFKALIYMHRYDENTIGRIRADYLFKMQRAYENELKRTQDTIDSSTNAREVAQAEKRKEKLTKQLKETRDYDQKIAHLALARISIDLDDGVKANYEKIQTAPDGKKLAILTPIK
jgi:type ii restriction enzyme, methylase subunit